jgi:hypothetical protein
MSLTPPQRYDELAPRRCPSNSVRWTLDKPHPPSSKGIYPYPTPLPPQSHRWIQVELRRARADAMPGVGDDVELETAIRQVVFDAVTAGGVIDIYAAAGIAKPDIQHHR